MEVPPHGEDVNIGSLNFSAEKSAAGLVKSFARPRKRIRLHRIRVRSNPKNYILDFKDTSSAEAKLFKSLDTFGRKSLSLLGLPGCGKTVILRALAYYAPVTSRFCDGIFLIPLSHCTDMLALFAYFSKILEYLDMPKGATEVRNIVGLPDRAYTDEGVLEPPGNNNDVDIRGIDLDRDNTSISNLCGETISKAMALIVNAISRMRVLLLFDNVDIRAEEVMTVIDCFNNTSPVWRQYSSICSTRNRDTARRFVSGNYAAFIAVHLHEPLGETSRAILCAHAGHQLAQLEDECRNRENPVVPVLQKCSGLSLALAVAGGAVRRLQSHPNETIERKVWTSYKNFIYNDVAQFGKLCKFFPSLRDCVENLPSLPMDKWDIVCSLGIVPNASWLPLQILKRLWRISPDGVCGIIRQLFSNCLVRRENRDINRGITIPNLVLDFCRVEASKRGGLRQWHMSLLSSYTDHERVSNEPNQRESLQVDTSERLYLELYLSHHYEGATAIDACETKDGSRPRLLAQGDTEKTDLKLARTAKRVISDYIRDASKGRSVILYR